MHKGNRTVTGQKTVVLAKTSYFLRKGRSATINLKQTKDGLALLAGAKAHPIDKRLIVSVRGGARVTGRLLIS
jgi:hypothetical protein